jgi:hypothetical protein
MRNDQWSNDMPITIRCERCPRVTDLYHCRSVDEYLCEACLEQVGDEENEDLSYHEQEC